MPRTLTPNKIDALKQALISHNSMADVAMEVGLSLSTCYKLAQQHDISTPSRRIRDLRLSLKEQNRLVEEVIKGTLYSAARAFNTTHHIIYRYLRKHYGQKVLSSGLPYPEGYRDYRIALYLIRNPNVLKTASMKDIATTLGYHETLVKRYLEK